MSYNGHSSGAGLMVLYTVEHMQHTDVCDLVKQSPIFLNAQEVKKQERMNPGHVKEAVDSLCLLVICGSRMLQIFRRTAEGSFKCIIL